jgi:tetratricopeptide (TPR) repeat protein
VKSIFRDIAIAIVGAIVFLATFITGVGDNLLGLNIWQLLGVVVVAVIATISALKMFFDPKPLPVDDAVTPVRKEVAAANQNVTDQATATRDHVSAENAEIHDLIRAESAKHATKIAEIRQLLEEKTGQAINPSDSVFDAIARMIESKDERKASAQAALDDGDIQGAASRLMGLAKQSGAGADDLSTDAAENAREAGALLYYLDTQKAIGAYELAEKYDPKDFWTRIYLARLYQRLGHLSKAEAEAETSKDLATTDRDRSSALNGLGNVLVSQGRGLEALEFYQEGLDIARALSEADETSAAAKRDVSVILNRVGDVLVSQGRGEEALELYQEGLDIARALSEADASSAAAKRDVSVGLDKVGNVLVSQGRGEEALEFYQEGLDIARALSEADETNAVAKRDVSVSLNKVGDVLVSQGRGDEALELYQEGLDIARALSKADETNVEAKRDVIVSLAKLGGVSEALTRPSKPIGNKPTRLRVRFSRAGRWHLSMSGWSRKRVEEPKPLPTNSPPSF